MPFPRVARFGVRPEIPERSPRAGKARSLPEPDPPTTANYAKMRRLLSATLFLSLCACAGEQPAARPDPVIRELATPAREGSGEPYLSSGEDAVIMSWLEAAPEEGHELRVARLGPDGWSEPVVAARGGDLFVNWADFPSVVTDAAGRLWAHWLQREPGEGLAYAVRVTTSEDGGATWSEAWTPHEDGTPTEHGFVSLFPWDRGIGLTWLDGRGYAPGPSGEEPTREMTVRFRFAGGPDGPGPEGLLDGRACDCCQTDVALTDEGPVVVYRDRTAEEVRDIHIARWTSDGWTEGVPVHEDGWVISGCPVNGPAVDAAGRRVAVAWFTGALEQPRVNVAFSDDGGRTFAAPIRVDAGDPAGRVDVRTRADGGALVSWLERTGGDRAEVRLARVLPDGAIEWSAAVSASSAARASGFPRMTLAPWDPDEVLLAWTDVTDPERSRVRVARVEVP